MTRMRPKMRSLGVRWLAGGAALLLPTQLAVAGAGVSADGYDAKTRAGIQEAVQGQLDAFAHGDASKAEEFAAPAIKERFPDPAAFMGMVRKDYGALIRPKSTQFTGVAASPHGPLQKVTVVAADGSVWFAIYSFEQVDGHWRITGCGLQKDETQQDI